MVRRIQIAFVSLVVGLAAATGGLAMARAVGPSAKAAAAKAPGAAIAKRQNALDRMALALRKARAQQPPKLPKVPHFAPVKMPSSSPSSASSGTWASSATSGAQAQQPVTYRRSKPVVRYVRPQPTQTQPSHRDDDEAEEEHDGEHEDEHEQNHEVEHEHDDGGHEGH